MEKLEQNGMVAVVISPDFGAGWSTENQDVAETLLMDKEIAEAVLKGDRRLAVEIAKRKTRETLFYCGISDACVQWIPKGTRFDVVQSEGNESIVFPRFTA